MLSKEDSNLLNELAKSCKDAKERERLRALYAVSIGHPVQTVAQIFSVDEATIYRWIEKWKTDKDLSDEPREGRPEKLTEKDKDGIKKLLDENNTKKHGMNASFWDTKELQIYFAEKGRKISRETLRAALKKMGAKYVKATLKYAEADLAAQRKFARQFLKEMRSKPNSVVILFQDEMAANCSARKGYGWTFEDRLYVKAPQNNRKKINCFGAVNPIKGEVIEMSSNIAKAPAFIRFLDKIHEKYKRKNVWIYLDNLKVHTSDKVKEWLEFHPSIELKFMPPHSPELNLQEQWWNYKRMKLLNNRSFATPHQLAIAMGWFAKKTSSATIRSVCSFAPIEKRVK